jgi:tetratricopeptide (TPR) repeat protein
LDLRALPRPVRAELRGVSERMAHDIGGHLLMAGQLIDSDPELAYQHAMAAKERSPRLPIVREALGEAAYAAEHYDVALTEFRALRRMAGRDDYLAAMADCERALGRPEAALRLVKEGLRAEPDVTALVELRLVEAGARSDLGQTDEAVRLLRDQIAELGAKGPKLARARLRYAYADRLEAQGRTAEAERWFATAAALDADHTTDAEDRVTALQGFTIVYDEDEDDGEPSQVGDEPGDFEPGDSEDGEAEDGEPPPTPDPGAAGQDGGDDS